ncbi:uncharacterized protein BDV17DRAFT_288713 [Aspergillus undulatus]|uniref:uncharacterized protein n=1 Tax=Aspergillus undulatus TaxID=1810928 RepID=UPI003CCD6A56
MLGSRFLFLIHKILLFIFSWPVSGATCTNKINDPVGIDFGPHFIFASYANSPTNFTLLAALDDDEYQLRHMQLWTESLGRRGLNKHHRPPPSFLASLIDNLSTIAARIPILKSVASFLVPGRLDPVTLTEVTETFTRLCREIKKTALKDHEVDVDFAISSVPDFFNDTINAVVVEACEQAGIESPHMRRVEQTGIKSPQLKRALPRLHASHFMNPEILPDSSVLAIHQGRYHCGIQLYRSETAGQEREKAVPYYPLDQWGSQSIQKQLVNGLLESNPSLRRHISLGANKNVLGTEISRARMVLKNRDPVVDLLGLDDGRDGISGSHGVDELPLNLDSWWMDGSGPRDGVKLTREQVRAADDHFVEMLASYIATYLEVSREENVRMDTHQPEIIDYALIVTDYVDGDLVRRAVKEALGDGVAILGGTLQIITMVADGVARIAWHRRQNLLKQAEWRGQRDEL